MKDKRPYIYTWKQLDDSKTHDQLWNAAQIQLRVEGMTHLTSLKVSNVGF